MFHLLWRAHNVSSLLSFSHNIVENLLFFFPLGGERKKNIKHWCGRDLFFFSFFGRGGYRSRPSYKGVA